MIDPCLRRTFTLGDAIRASRPLPEPIIDGVARRGEVLSIVGQPNVGKSWLALDLGIALSSGARWLGRFPTKQVAVLLVDGQHSRDVLGERARVIAEARGIRGAAIGNMECHGLAGGVQLTAYQLHDLAAAFDVVIFDPIDSVEPIYDGMAAARLGEVARTLADLAGDQRLVVVTGWDPGPMALLSDIHVTSTAARSARAGCLEILPRSFPNVGALRLKRIGEAPVWASRRGR